MYTRPPQGRFPRGMRIPQNYSGNTFRPTVEESAEPKDTEVYSPSEIPVPIVEEYVRTEDTSFEEEHRESPSPCEHDSCDPKACQVCDKSEKKASPHGFHMSLGNLLPSLGKDGFGSEELLLLALILLLTGSEGNDDLVLLLILLLFVR